MFKTKQLELLNFQQHEDGLSCGSGGYYVFILGGARRVSLFALFDLESGQVISSPALFLHFVLFWFLSLVVFLLLLSGASWPELAYVPTWSYTHVLSLYLFLKSAACVCRPSVSRSFRRCGRSTNPKVQHCRDQNKTSSTNNYDDD